MTVIRYTDGFGDHIVEYTQADTPGGVVYVSHNESGWRLYPPGCGGGCEQPAVWKVTRTRVGTSLVYCCTDHLPGWAAAVVTP